MKAIITGGGTGGHIYPAIAILEELKKRHKNIEILYIGTKDSMEEKIASNLGINFKAIRVKGMPRKINKKFFASLKELIIGLSQTGKIISQFKPDVVIGTGGFVTGPVLLRAALKGYKTVIHEQNSLPGVTNRILSRFVSKILVTYSSSIRYFKNSKKCIVTGNPIRSAVDNRKKLDSSFNKYNFVKDKKVVFSFGGSNGSESQNEAVADMINKYIDEIDFQIIHATGEKHYEKFMEKIGLNKNSRKISIHPYIHDIASSYDIADLVIASSGAITLAELSSMGLASILIPKSYTTENHQQYNAMLYQEIGAAEMILEDELNSDLLYNKIKGILKEDKSLEIMGENAKKLGNPNATKDIVDIIDKMI